MVTVEKGQRHWLVTQHLQEFVHEGVVCWQRKLRLKHRGAGEYIHFTRLFHYLLKFIFLENISMPSLVCRWHVVLAKIQQGPAGDLSESRASTCKTQAPWRCAILGLGEAYFGVAEPLYPAENCAGYRIECRQIGGFTHKGNIPRGRKREMETNRRLFTLQKLFHINSLFSLAMGIKILFLMKHIGHQHNMRKHCFLLKPHYLGQVLLF